MKRTTIILLAVAALCLLAWPVFAAPLPDVAPVVDAPAAAPLVVNVVLADPAADPQGFASVVMGAATARRWGFVAVLVLLGALALLRKLGGKVWSGFTSDTGGAALALGFALVLPLAIVLASSARLTWPLYVGAVTATEAASGLWGWAKKLGRALLGWVGKKLGLATAAGGAL